jgi:hypothetical protein
MDGIKSTTKSQISPGDLAVDGIFTGIEAGIVMAVFLAAVSAQNHISPVELLSTFSFKSSPTWISGLLTHLAVSSIYGIFFSIGTYFIFRRSSTLKVSFFVPFSGLIYGSLLWIAAEYYLFDLTAVQLKEVPTNILLAAHLIFGLALGFLVQRRRRSTFSQSQIANLK